jgi:arginyl-tRNA synthetase
MPEDVKIGSVHGLRAAVNAATEAVGGVEAPAGMTLERPPRPELGDYSTNAAMLLAPLAGAPPRELAERLAVDLEERLAGHAAQVQVAGPGFVNLFLSARWHRQAVTELLSEAVGADGGGERIMVEFVSANPTGPLTVASGRGAAFGDALARILERRGHPVEREYLLNDVGGQVRLFGDSLAARMRGEEPPEGGYEGEYVAELADELAAKGLDPEDRDALARAGTEAMRSRIAATLDRFGVTFDTWFSERTLHDDGKLEAVVDDLRKGGQAYERDGAVWLRTSDFGDDKDRVLIRADGEPTYFVADIAYHRDKLDRGAERLIVPLGADHHGYVPRMRAALAALGVDPDVYEAPIMQLMNVVEGGARAKMSKRRGDFVTLDELLDDIGVDAARWFLVGRSHDTALDLDLDLARKASQDNPVYYVQYAHARIDSILRKAVAEGVVPGSDDGAEESALLAAATSPDALGAATEPSETALVRRLLELPAEIAEAADRRTPHRLCAYASATAADFHAFYRDCQVVGAPAELEGARLGLCLAAKRTIGETLGLLGISAPARM